MFSPPWETKIGQLQQVTKTIQHNSDAVLDNRGAVIVRCYPYRSTTYMHLVYNLIYSTLASNTQFGSEQTPDEIRPILLNYNTGHSNSSTNAAKQSLSSASAVSHSTAPFGAGVYHFGGHPQQHQWTDFVLIRVHFRSHECAQYFMQMFNRSVFRVFDRSQVRAPFCHADLTRPERVLRNYLQQLCDEKNNSVANRFHSQQQQQYYRGHLYSPTPRYYHNGFHLYREFPNGRVELVPWEQFSLGQYLHVIVASLRKYAALYKQKQCYVIIQNIAEHTGSAEEDTERITSIVYSIVSTDEYRQRCVLLKVRFRQSVGQAEPNKPNSSSVWRRQKLELLKNPTAAKTAGAQQQQPNSHANNTSNHLPQRIERLPRRSGISCSASRSTATLTTTTLGGGEERKGTKGVQQQTADNKQRLNQLNKAPRTAEDKQQKGGSDADNVAGAEQNVSDESPKSASSRPALIRVQFHTREAAIAFCQLFKERQLCLRQKQHHKQEVVVGGHDKSGNEGEDDDVVIVKHHTAHTAGDADVEDEDQQTDSYSDLSDVFSSNEERQDSLIIGAFAHRDLTPPELALGYALRQHCREKNSIPNARVHLYPRGGRIIERPSAAG